jgi:hypothetical protein
LPLASEETSDTVNDEEVERYEVHGDLDRAVGALGDGGGLGGRVDRGPLALSHNRHVGIVPQPVAHDPGSVAP